jgi:hypothetical protein
MKNQNIVFIAIAFALAFALAPVTKAGQNPGGIPTPEAATNLSAASANSTGPEGENLPVITIHSAGNILRGKTGSFVLEMKPALMLGGMHVNFKVSGTAVAGVDYVPLLSPTYIGQSGYGVISLKTLADPRAASSHQAYSVVVTLEPGLGYALGAATSRSALIWISTSCVLEACW